MKTDYYELLEISADATDIEIKKAYRKAALKHHPDKNPDRIEEATIIFAEIKAAYEVLSDPQERSWYDNHKNQILRENYDNEDSTHYDNDIDVGITVDDLLRFFDPILYTRFDDSPAGFYSIITGLFDTLKQDETTVVSKPDHDLFPIFGDSKSDYETVVRKFYSSWSNFQSSKTFMWFDQYNISARMDRRTRRHVEKTNKKLRDAAKKNYNETVRDLVSFLKKRDPRVKVGVEKLEQKKKLQKMQQHEENNRKLKEKDKLKEDFKVQDWQRYEFEEVDFDIDNDETKNFVDGIDGIDDEVEIEVEIFECVVCDKIFKSEKQLFAHELTNKHKKELKRLRWQMKKEGLQLGLDSDESSEEEQQNQEDDDAYLTANETELDDDDTDDKDFVSSPKESQNNKSDEEVINIPVDDVIEEHEQFENEDFVTVSISSKKKNKKKKKKQQQQNNKNQSNSEMESKDNSDILAAKEDELKKLSEAVEKGINLDSDDDNDWSIGSNKKKSKNKKKKKK